MSETIEPTRLLQGRIALVTGGSRGLGRAICEVFAREGAHVAFNYLKSEAEAEQTLATIRAHGVQGWAFKVSVVDKPAVWEMVRQIEREAGAPIDLLINNAGVAQVVPTALMEIEDWDRVMDTNVKGAFVVTQAVMRGMIHQKRGHILNIGSLAGVKMMHAPVHYAAAKAALKGFTEALAKEVGRYGILVNCLAPGLLEGGVSRNVPPRKLSQYLDHCALGRLGTLEEAAELAALLVSERNTYMHGATIVLDGAL